MRTICVFVCIYAADANASSASLLLAARIHSLVCIICVLVCIRCATGANASSARHICAACKTRRCAFSVYMSALFMPPTRVRLLERVICLLARTELPCAYVLCAYVCIWLTARANTSSARCACAACKTCWSVFTLY